MLSEDTHKILVFAGPFTKGEVGRLDPITEENIATLLTHVYKQAAGLVK